MGPRGLGTGQASRQWAREWCYPLSCQGLGETDGLATGFNDMSVVGKSNLFLDGLPAAFVTLVEQVQIASGLVGFCCRGYIYCFRGARIS